MLEKDANTLLTGNKSFKVKEVKYQLIDENQWQAGYENGETVPISQDDLRTTLITSVSLKDIQQKIPRS